MTEETPIREMTREDVQRAIDELEAVGKPESMEVDLATAMRAAENVWWKTKFYSREGLGHLFPGLGSKVKK